MFNVILKSFKSFKLGSLYSQSSKTRLRSSMVDGTVLYSYYKSEFIILKATANHHLKKKTVLGKVGQ